MRTAETQEPLLELPKASDYSTYELRERSGEKISVYSDGLIGTMDARDQQYMLERLVQIAQENCRLSRVHFKSIMIAESERLAVSYHDDVSLVIIQIP